jgi:hypothetical protein
MIKRECTIPLPLGRPRDDWAKCLRDTLFLFAAERRLESFAMRPVSPGGVVGSGWTVTLEGTDSQLPEDSDTLTAKLRDDAERGWLLAYDVEGDEGIDVRIPASERDKD